MVAIVTAASEYAKDSRLKPGDIKLLREWLQKQPHLPQNITDEFLITVIHSAEYSLEQAKQLLETNIECRTNFTEMFDHRDPMQKNKQLVWDFLELWSTGPVTKENYCLFFGGLHNTNPDPFDFDLSLNMAMNVLDTHLRVEGVHSGYFVILNCKGFSLSHLTKSNISHIRNLVTFAQEGVCIKIKAIHIININPIVDKIMFIIKPMLKKALLDMMFFHTGEMEDFYKSVPRDLLPVEIGGTAGSRNERMENTRNRVEQMSDWLIEMESLRVDNNKRPNGKRDVYSVAGSFRKLDLD